MKAWKQFLQVYDCPDCGNADGRTWFLDGVWLAVAPCAKHLRMLATQGWKLA